MGILTHIKSKLVGSPKETPAQTDFDVELFVYAMIPESIGPIERGEKYEDQIEPLLTAEGLGSISGGGCSLGDPQPDGKRFIEYCGIDIDTTDRDAARALIRSALQKIGAPVGTELHFTKNGRQLQDAFSENGWLLEQPRTFLHPGLGV